MQKFNLRSKKSVYALVLSIMLILMYIFTNSFFWPYEGISKRKILVGIIVFLGVVVVPILMAKNTLCYQCVVEIMRRMENAIESIRMNKKRILCFVCCVLAGVVMSYIVTHVVSVFVLHTTYNSHLFYTMITLLFALISIVFMWRNASKKPEKIFVVIALIVGIFCISVTPIRVGVSWDDEVHYAKTLEISNFLNGIMYKADEKNIIDYANNIYAHSGYDRATNSQYIQELESLYAAKEWSAHEFSNYGVWSVGYIPSAIGVMFARGIELSYVGVFNMGRVFNLLMYVLLIYLSIKRVRYGKVLIAAIGLIPTSIFMASSYSYDPWVTGFTILGFSYFFAELQDDTPLKNRNIIIMIGAIALGCLPKAIYFPLFFPLLFMPKKKFKSPRQRRYYYLAIIGAGIFLVATFLLPMILNGAGTGDARGGSEVNSTEQIFFILKSPLAYVKILLKFLLDYITLGNAGAMLQKFAYVGDGYFYSTVSLMLALLAFLDRGENEKNYFVAKGASLIGCAVAIVLATTALYISFTPVAYGTVLGMQGRYMIPTIYPALCSLGLGGTTHKINKNAFVCVPMLMIAFTVILNMFRLCVLHY